MSSKVNLERWVPHLMAAKREGETLARYARSHGLSRHTLYAARQMLRRAGGTASAQRRARVFRGAGKPVPAFAAVKLSAVPAALIGSAPRLQARLPNGVTMELSCGGADAALLTAMIQALAGR